MPKVNILFAFLLSVLTLFGIFYFSAGAFTLSTGQIVTLCLSALAWVGYFLYAKDSTSPIFTSPLFTNPLFTSLVAQNSNKQNNVSQLSESLTSLINSIKTELGTQITATNAELSQVKSLMDDAIDDLVDSFISLEASTRIEQKLVMLLASNNAENDNDELNPFREKQLKSKQLLKDIASKLNTLIKDAKHNESACGALNDIELAAEKSVTQLEIVLGEISSTSNAALVEEIRKGVQQLHKSISKANNTVDKLYASSKIYTKESKDIANKINEIIDENNNNIAIVADEIALTAEQIEKDVQTAVQSLQFQDMTTQLIAQCGERQKIMQDILNALSAVSLISKQSSLDDLQIKLSTTQSELQQISKVRMKQFNVNSGSVELF